MNKLVFHIPKLARKEDIVKDTLPFCPHPCEVTQDDIHSITQQSDQKTIYVNIVAINLKRREAKKHETQRELMKDELGLTVFALGMPLTVQGYLCGSISCAVQEDCPQ